ncbi:MAG: hypothetical protein JNK40_10630 [Chromatiales bacterium]|nr:hypothetical protein [Chromatiales bacterium]
MLTIRSRFLCAIVLCGPAIATSAQAATTFVTVSAQANDSCSTQQECFANLPGNSDYSQASDPTGSGISRSAQASGAYGRTTALAEASAGVGWLRVGASGNGAGTVSGLTPVAMTTYSQAIASWTDSLLLSAPGTFSGVYLTVDLIIDGGLVANQSGPSTAISNFTLSLKSPWPYVPPSAGGQNNSDNLYYQLQESATSGTTFTRQVTKIIRNAVQPIVTTNPPLQDSSLVGEIWTFRQWFPTGFDTTFIMEMVTNTSGSLGRIGLEDGSGNGTGAFGAASDFRHTIQWGGISAITDQFGNDVSQLVTITSGSGVNYLQPINAPPVPLPGTLVSLATGVAVLGARTRWARRRREPAVT